MARRERQVRVRPKSVSRSLAAYFGGERLPPEPDTEEGRLTYDVVLALRGWGPDAFARVTPEFKALVVRGLFLEKAVPILQYWRGVQAAPTEGASPQLLGEKLQAARVVPFLTNLIYPEDADG